MINGELSHSALKEIVLDIRPGVNIQAAFLEAVALAIAEHTLVTFEFSGHVYHADPRAILDLVQDTKRLATRC